MYNLRAAAFACDASRWTRSREAQGDDVLGRAWRQAHRQSRVNWSWSPLQRVPDNIIPHNY
jgi:hypothetical protein